MVLNTFGVAMEAACLQMVVKECSIWDTPKPPGVCVMRRDFNPYKTVDCMTASCLLLLMLEMSDVPSENCQILDEKASIWADHDEDCHGS